MATTIPIKSISAAKPPNLTEARAAYADAIRELDSSEQTAELLRLADIANVRLRRHLDRG
jgi:hypothetical protein